MIEWIILLCKSHMSMQLHMQSGLASACRQKPSGNTQRAAGLMEKRIAGATNRSTQRVQILGKGNSPCETITSMVSRALHLRRVSRQTDMVFMTCLEMFGNGAQINIALIHTQFVHSRLRRAHLLTIRKVLRPASIPTIQMHQRCASIAVDL